MLHCNNRRICIQNVSMSQMQEIYKMYPLSQSQEMHKAVTFAGCVQNILLSKSQDTYTNCFVVTIAGYVHKMFCCHNRKICIQNAFADIIAGYVHKMFCCHNRKIFAQNVLLPQSQDMYTKCFCQNTFSYFLLYPFCHTYPYHKKIEKPHVQIQNNGIEILLSPSRSVTSL